jgi:hypothetical protein
MFIKILSMKEKGETKEIYASPIVKRKSIELESGIAAASIKSVDNGGTSITDWNPDVNNTDTDTWS